MLRLQRERYWIPLEEVGGVAECGPLRPVPLAPSAVLGLTEWRGRLLTVIDLPRLLDDRPGGGPPSLIRLGPPFAHTALIAPGPVRFCHWVDAQPRGNGASRGPGGRRIDPQALLRRIERGRNSGDERQQR